MALTHNLLIVRQVLARDAKAESTRRPKGRDAARERCARAAQATRPAALALLGSRATGLTREEARRSRDNHGENQLTTQAPPSLFDSVCDALCDPFMAIMAALGAVSWVTDVALAPPGDQSWATVIVIGIMLALSLGLRVYQERRTLKAMGSLERPFSALVTVRREGQAAKIPATELAVGDVFALSAGDVVPCDARVLESASLHVEESALTGESDAVPKRWQAFDPLSDEGPGVCMVYRGTNVVGGHGLGVAVAVGDETRLGRIAREASSVAEQSPFDRGIASVSRIFLGFMLVMAPLVLVVNGLTKGDWLSAVLFAATVAVGLTPEMLPLVVTTDLALGAQALAKRGVIVKAPHAVQTLGSMDVLCSDKTGTLTSDDARAACWLDGEGQKSAQVLELAAATALLQRGKPGAVDRALMRAWEACGRELPWAFVAEAPFDFVRRRSSVLMEGQGKRLLVCKGSLEEVLRCCDVTAERAQAARRQERALEEKGLRTLAVAVRPMAPNAAGVSVKDERELSLLGLVGLADPPKPGCEEAVASLAAHGVRLKVLTGDGLARARAVCEAVNVPTESVLTGPQVEAMGDHELAEAAERTTVFARLSPAQKARVVRALKASGHTVGFLGDGINDAPALRAADVGVTVDTATDVAREAADVVLTEKSLGVLDEGVVLGRSIHANVMKYLKITAASNFGNVFSVMAASLALPFLPMEAIQLVLLNLVWDLSCICLPFDSVDEDWLAEPHQWDAASVRRFMVCFGPLSSVFDLLTFCALWFVICPLAAGGAFPALDGAGQLLFAAVFQAGWMAESIWTQTLVLHVLRTGSLWPFKRPASAPVLAMTAAGGAVVTAFALTPLGSLLGLAVPPLPYLGCLVAALLGYCLLTTVVKSWYVGRYGSLL